MPKSQLLQDLKGKIFGYLATKKDDELRKLSKIKPEQFFYSHLLPEKATQNPAIEDEPKKLILGFIYFRSDFCKFETADDTKMKSLLEKLMKLCEFTASQFFTCELIPRPINRSTGNYAQLYTNLGDDVDIYEFDFAGQGRIYGFIVENIFHLVVVDAKHRNTN